VLDKRSFNITKELGRIIKVFEDFRLVQQIREEIERVRPLTNNLVAYVNK